MNCRSIIWRLAWMIICPSMLGCHDSGYVLAPVSGKVTLNGEPLVGGRVTLQPTGGSETPGPGSIGDTDAQGAYVLKTIHDEPGAVVGRHRVSIISNPYREAPKSDLDTNPGVERVPKRYNLLSEIILDVPKEGLDSANFDLTAP
ncbi:MAG: hypothetical protein JW829_11825 [Pirellulales bacterium]|nr:hypothetical protein [Pirellulales bacterium]